MSSIDWSRVVTFNVITPSSSEDGTGKSLFRVDDAVKMPELVQRLHRSKMSTSDANGSESDGAEAPEFFE